MGKYNLFADESAETADSKFKQGRMDKAMRKGIATAEESQSVDIATGQQLIRKLEQQQYCCALSGLPLTPGTASLDHILPVKEGGGHSIDNVQWLHTDVNKMKHTLPEARFKDLCRLIAGSEKTTEEDW